MKTQNIWICSWYGDLQRMIVISENRCKHIFSHNSNLTTSIVCLCVRAWLNPKFINFFHQSTFLVNELSLSIHFPQKQFSLLIDFSCSMTFLKQSTFLNNQLSLSIKFPHQSNFLVCQSTFYVFSFSCREAFKKQDQKV